MSANSELRHKEPTVPVSTNPPETVTRSLFTRRPQIGDRARLWDYVESEWIEGKIESIQAGYRILVRCSGHLEETAGWHLAFREGVWEEDIIGVTGTD